MERRQLEEARRAVKHIRKQFADIGVDAHALDVWLRPFEAEVQNREHEVTDNGAHS